MTHRLIKDTIQTSEVLPNYLAGTKLYTMSYTLIYVKQIHKNEWESETPEIRLYWQKMDGCKIIQFENVSFSETKIKAA